MVKDGKEKEWNIHALNVIGSPIIIFNANIQLVNTESSIL